MHSPMRRRATAWRSSLADRPVLGRDRRGIGADDFGQRVAPGAQQRRGKIVLDVVDQAKALVDQRRNKAGSGWRRRGSWSARRRRYRCRRRRSAETRPRRAHRSRPPSASTAETAAAPTIRPALLGAESARARSRAAPAWYWPRSCRRRGASARCEPRRRVRRGSDPARSSAAPANRRRSAAPVRAHRSPRARRSSSACACCRLRRPGVFGDDTLTVK